MALVAGVRYSELEGKLRVGDGEAVVVLTFARRGDDRKFRNDDAWEDVWRAYLACISWADYNVGRLIEALEDSAYADNTIVVLWSDHGYGMGEKQHFRKFALWEDVTRVPFIILDTRDKNAPVGREVGDGVSLVNIYKTLADLCELETPDYLDGFSLVPQLKDTAAKLAGSAICTWGGVTTRFVTNDGDISATMMEERSYTITAAIRTNGRISRAILNTRR